MRWAGGPIFKDDPEVRGADAVPRSASPLAAGCLFPGDLRRRDDTSQWRLSSAGRAHRRRVARCGRWNLAAIEFQDKQANGRR